MSERRARYRAAASRFMPRLWDFAYPISGRGYRQARLIAFRAWAYAFRVRMAIAEMQDR